VGIENDLHFVDPRTDRLRSVWGYSGTNDVDLVLTTDAAERKTNDDESGKGTVAFLHSGSKAAITDVAPVPTVRPVYRYGDGALTKKAMGDPVGYSWLAPDPEGLRSDLSQKFSDPRANRPSVGLSYQRPFTAGAIHSQFTTVTQGVNTLRFNRAAGGYLESWKISGVEILNRANSWGRGLQQMAEWTDLGSELVCHRPSQAGSRFATSPGAQGSLLISLTETARVEGGRQVTIVTIPLEWDPDGSASVPGISTDHGGQENSPVLWRDMRVTTSIWIDYMGQSGLHLIDTAWTVPFDTKTFFLDCGVESALFLDTRFDVVYAYNAFSNTLTDVSAAVAAVNWRRWSVCDTKTFQDEQAAPSSATTIAQGWGAAAAREAATDLTVMLGGRMHLTSGAASLKASDFPRGTNVTYMVNRSGTTGYDGSQAVVLGHDILLSGRWHGHDSERRLTSSGTLRHARFLAIGTLAATRAAFQALPATY
jgi:hypothetical protein